MIGKFNDINGLFAQTAAKEEKFCGSVYEGPYVIIHSDYNY